jgi:hypothetical protein
MNILQVIAERFNTFTAEKITSLSRIVNINSKDHILREYPINVKNSSTQSEDVNYTNMCLHRFLGTFSVKRCSERAVAST